MARLPGKQAALWTQRPTYRGDGPPKGSLPVPSGSLTLTFGSVHVDKRPRMELGKPQKEIRPEAKRALHIL